MYLNFFNLKLEPFQITPDPSFLFLSPGHKEALASIIYGVEKKKGFVLIVGAVGVGKTTILRAYLEKTANEKLKTIYLFNANISYTNLLKYIFRELEVVPDSNEVFHMVNQLHQVLINEYRQGRNVLLLIDEAQNMPVDTLENLRMLSNLETATEKLIQIVFSAQLEFEKTLNMDELKQLKQRIAVKAVISPLTSEEGVTYIQHRLKRASNNESEIFTKLAMKEIVNISKGIPRVINVLCDNGLITAFGYGKKKVSLRIAEEITKDFGMRRPFYLRWPLKAVLATLVAVTVCWVSVNVEIFKEGKPIPSPKTVNVHENVAAKLIIGSRSIVQSEQNVSMEKVIERGDTLAKLIKDVYGHVDARMIQSVIEANPNIDNENLIIEGAHIVFPFKKKLH